MDFRAVCKVFYNNKLFQMLINENNFRYFVEYKPDGTIQYPELEDLIGLEIEFVKNPHVLNAKRDSENEDNQKKKSKIWPKVLIGGVVAPLTLSILLMGFSIHSWRTTPDIEIKVQRELGFLVEERAEDLEIEYFRESPTFPFTYVYDVEYLDKIFPNEVVTKDMVVDVIKNNPNITGRYEPFLLEFLDLYTKAYPNADLRILYHNFETLKIVECADEIELLKHTLSLDSYACYMMPENTIYTAASYDYKKGTWDYQVIMHELAHASRTYWRDSNDDGRIDIKAQADGLNMNYLSVNEALNSIFTVNMFDYEERDIAYQLQSNMLLAILDSIDTYEIGDYANHSVSYFASKLDEFTGHHNYASVMLHLMDTQYNDYHSDRIEIPEREYYPLYDYISDIYYKTRIHSGMSHDEMLAVCDELVERVTYDVPAEYHIDTTHFYTYLEDYIMQNNYGVGIVK